MHVLNNEKYALVKNNKYSMYLITYSTFFLTTPKSNNNIYS